MFFFFNYKHYPTVAVAGRSAAVAGSEGGTYERDVTVWKKKRRKVYAPDKYVKYPAKHTEVVLKEVTYVPVEAKTEITPKAAKAVSYLGKEVKKVKRKLPKTVAESYIQQFTVPVYITGLIAPKLPSEAEKKSIVKKALKNRDRDNRRKSSLKVKAAVNNVPPISKEEIVQRVRRILEDQARKKAAREAYFKEQYRQKLLIKKAMEEHAKRLEEEVMDTVMALLAAGEEEAAIAFYNCLKL